MTTFVSIDDDILVGNGAGYVYQDDDVEVTIQPGVTVQTAGQFASAIVSTKAASRLINNGEVVSVNDVAVAIGGPDAAITNNPGGVISGGHSGVWVNSGSINSPASAAVVNHGEITGRIAYGVQFSFTSGGNELTNHGLIAGVIAGVGGNARIGNTTIENSGTIEGDQLGVVIGSGSAQVVNTIHNRADGKIKGGDAAIAIPSGGQIALRNEGKVVGDIDCDAVGRNDKIVNKGKIKGDVALGPGADKFVFAGGKQGKVFGESEADKFVFRGKLVSEKNAPKIADFTPGEDMIALSKGLFKGLGEKGALKAKLFHVGREAADEDDRIVYDRRSGKLWDDRDGAGGADARLIARLDDGLALKANDVLVVA